VHQGALLLRLMLLLLRQRHQAAVRLGSRRIQPEVEFFDNCPAMCSNAQRCVRVDTLHVADQIKSLFSDALVLLQRYDC
jgi:hypothetical protein